mgnify:CR=1 FL=1
MSSPNNNIELNIQSPESILSPPVDIEKGKFDFKDF